MVDRQGKVYPAWTPQEEAELAAHVERLGHDKHVWPIIGELMKRTALAVKWRYLRRREAKLDADGKPKSPKLRSQLERNEAADLAQAQRLAAMDLPRSLTAEFFGDPLPGRSALDQRAHAVPEHRITLPGMAP